TFIGLYTAPTYPSPAHPSYIEAYPVPNEAIPRNITLSVGPGQTLEMQPFAQFRGGLVLGSDTLRHGFTLLNQGGEFCMNFVDLIFENDQALHHAGGRITVNNAYSCMQFKKGGEFRIREGASLHYGDNGSGMLVVCADGSLVLERNAALTIDAILQISECNDALPPSHVYVDLPPGARLAFTENAWITNRFSKGQQMRLRVRMLGGTLDDTALGPDSRALIERIYPTPAPHWADNVQLAPNPFSNRITLTYTTAREGETLAVRWLDTSGRLLAEETLRAARGINEWALQRLPAQSGLYLLDIRSEDGQRTVRKVLRAR
ncbi:MAG: T9SS type A sorting domain-containing protein, partial [Saprospiraceae bacterium]|nr:T9SS type A sorting domain-containing protein [Saprospiraceae bacterium]